MSRSGDWIGFIPRTIPKRWHYGERGALPTFSGKKKRKKEKTPLKAAHANEELARWRDLGKEEGESVFRLRVWLTLAGLVLNSGSNRRLFSFFYLWVLFGVP